MTVQQEATQGIILTDVAAAKVSSLLAQEGRDDLKWESDLTRWFPVWGAPGL